MRWQICHWGYTKNTHPMGLGGLIIHRIHDKEIRNSGTSLWMGSILQDILNNVLKEARSLTIFHKAPLSLHISFFCGFIIRLRWTDSSFPLPGGKKNPKNYFYFAVDLCVLVWKPPETPTTLCLSVHSSLHHWLTSSHAYLLIKLQDLWPRRDALRERRMTTQWKQTVHRWFIFTICFKIAEILGFFGFFSRSSFLTWCLLDSWGLSKLLLSEQECNISTVK